ncbi:lytic murein transglycosylase [Dongia sedimenti]|uniref:Lytic murein transglycosylase n=1 Tax=Dongia sedimenti TaxID=3064282 RepID=A0ABU0YGY1_9PROT|nr:lytic murein transglycosylase [Rhodospirillaceae bacterium R-7]
MRKFAIVGALLVLSACAAAPNPAPLPPSGPIPVADRYAFTKLDQKTCPTEAKSFADWVERYEAFAYKGGQPKELIADAFENVKENPSITVKQSKQPEFVTPVWTYLSKAVSDDRVARGQQQYALNRAVVDATARQYGVDSGTLMGIWGIETDFGRNFGDVNVFEALSNLGYGAKRTDFACSEMTAALTIANRDRIPVSKMIGSWAGAMGHSQFLPSNYLQLAVDADRSGAPDLWTSMPDVFASTANHLTKAGGGWLTGVPAFVEVKLPLGFPYQQAELDLEQPVAHWRQLGVKTVGGMPLPELPGGTAIIVLAGWKGPAFLITKNFKAILRYNNSTSYALSVAYLGQRILGGPGVQAAWPTSEPALNLAEREEIQTRLAAQGYDVGKVDGVLGLKTRKAVRLFQAKIAVPQDGYANKALLLALRSQPSV